MSDNGDVSFPYRTNAGAILRRTSDGCVLMGERICPRDGIWQFPQGGVEPNESREEALWREIREELGIPDPHDVCRLVGRGPPVTYDFESPGPDYAGQEQVLFLVEFDGDPDRIRLDRYQEPEFESICWVPLERTLDLIMPRKRPVLVRTLEALEGNDEIRD